MMFSSARERESIYGLTESMTNKIDSFLHSKGELYIYRIFKVVDITLFDRELATYGYTGLSK